jgi:hypothetical protein
MLENHELVAVYTDEALEHQASIRFHQTIDGE